MDFATHALVPMAGALIALGYLRRDEPQDRSRAAFAAVFGIAGFAPDLDSLVDPLSEHVDALYFLQHRGFSHSLAGGPVFALVALGVLVLLARLWPRGASLFVWRPMLVPAAIVGSWTHLVLDGITYSGVPLLWPFAFGRFGFPLFHYLVIWLVPIAGLALGLHAFRRLSRRRVAQTGAFVVLVLVVLAGARAANRPWDEPEGTRVFPQNSMFAWTLATPHENGTWLVETYRDGARHDPMWFTASAPPDAEAAIARARDTDAYKGFLMGSFGPVVIDARREGDAWNVSFVDVAQRYEALRGPRWAPVEPFDLWGRASFLVPDEGPVRPIDRGW